MRKGVPPEDQTGENGKVHFTLWRKYLHLFTNSTGVSLAGLSLSIMLSVCLSATLACLYHKKIWSGNYCKFYLLKPEMCLYLAIDHVIWIKESARITLLTHRTTTPQVPLPIPYIKVLTRCHTPSLFPQWYGGSEGYSVHGLRAWTRIYRMVLSVDVSERTK